MLADDGPTDMEEGGDLGDVVLSWSMQQILGAEQQVQKIPREFSSLDNYFKAFIAPLVEETRSQISSSLEVIREAPYSEIISMEEDKDTRLLYKMNLDIGYTSDTYVARNGDILILSTFKPRIVEDLLQCGPTLVMVVSTVQHQKELRVKVSSKINTEERETKFKYAVFATNIMTNTRIWNALCSEKTMNKNFTIIKLLLSPKNMGDNCDICPEHVGNSLPYLVEKLTQSRLNTSQLGAIISIISAVQCKHSNLVKLIWGPPGTGKTKTISAMLWALESLKCRTLMCSPTNISVVGVCTRLLQDLKDLNEHADTDGLPYSLGDIVLFGNKHKMDTSNIQEILMDYRVDQLVNCFSSKSGWKNRIVSLISFLEDFGRTGPSCLLDFHKQFGDLASDLKDCILNLWIHLPKRCFSPEVVRNILDLFDLLKTMCLSSEDLTCDYAKRGYYALSAGESTSSKHVSLGTKWVEARGKCLELLKSLKISFDLPVNVSKSWARNYCMHNATIIFCTVSSSYHIHELETTLDVLIIDEAAQVRECESVIPLRLNGLRHTVLVGDDCQLQPIIQSRVCNEAGLGVSLFKRLCLLGFEKHLLNMQYRMSPCISLFPNTQFYEGRIIDNFNVKSASYNKDYLDLPFGSYAFLNIVHGKEEREGSGNSWQNMVEVAVVMHLIQSVFKSWNNTLQKMTIGVVSPYSSQVNAIKSRIGTKYDNCHGFSVRVASIDGFQGGEDDIIILSTVRSNTKGAIVVPFKALNEIQVGNASPPVTFKKKGAIGFLADNQRTNVALTRARHCLWILGNACTLSISGTIWAAIAEDAKKRGCLFNATDNAALAKLVFEVKAELDQLGDLLNSGSAAFCNTKWKIVFSTEFRNAFMKLKSAQLRREVLQKLVGLGCGWRSRVKNLGANDKFELAKVYKISDLYLIWSIDLENGGGFFQIIRIWGLVAFQNIERTIQRLQNLFSMYTDDYVEHCKIVHREGKWEVPVNWGVGYDIARFKKDQQVDAPEDDDHVDASHSIDHSKVSESFLLMKFYTLSSGVAKHLLAATDGSESDIPFEMTEEEKAIIQFPCSSFILGRSGTGKTTVITMKLIQKEQQSLIACNGLNFEFELSGMNDKNDRMNLKDVNTGQGSIRQIFLTVSSHLCSYVKNQIFRLRRFASGDLFDHSCGLQMHVIFDDSAEFDDIPDNFSNIPQSNYPLAITFRKFLLMLDGTLRSSFFDRFYGELTTLHEGGKLKSRALQDYIKTKEVDYEKFSCSYWPHFDANLTKNLDASTVFTQIISHIKGGHQACKYPYGTLEKQDYVMLSDRRFPSLNTKTRGMIYDIYLSYEKRKCVSQEFDISDFVKSLHCRLTTEGYNGDTVDCVYIDEVQDMTMNQMTLLKFVCSNVKEGFVFAGDMAQTIAKGVDFRFEDIRSFFYTEFLPKASHGKAQNVSDMFQLTQNLRTHCGIILLAQSIMDLLYYFFPFSVDKLNAETSLIHGDAPILLESCNGENALTTIFGQIQNECCKWNMFGANQVILVRDDSTKEHVTDIVGKQALVLTVLESKGLEFEDVLLYNFFSSSPLRNKWRVIYGYRKENSTTASSKQISYPEFDGIKHFLLCSELKQLYVAVTRTKQRLWICEDENDLCQPMFDYWKQLCLVQVKQLDSALVEEMQTTSSPDDWRLRGIKLFNERQFGLASMCFQKAGDEHREKWAGAALHVANGERLISGNWRRAHSYFVKAAEIYDSIGKHEKAATCFIKSKDFEKAGVMYLEKCGDSRLEDAAGCFAMAKCWKKAANAYFRAKCYTKCFAACFKGEHFHLGLKFVRQLEETHSFEGANSSELNATRNKYLEDCASYYFHHKDLKHMMQFVKAFSSSSNVRAFLTSRTLFNELLCFEVEMGNFIEAAKVAEHIGSVLVREGSTYSGDIAQHILLHIIMNMLWNSNVKKRYPKGYVGDEKLRKKAREIVQKMSRLYCTASLEADALCDPRKSLAKLSNDLLVGNKQGNTLLQFFGSRAILDIHLLFRSSRYTFEFRPDLETVRCDQDILSHNQMSPNSLICTWNIWKSMMLEVLLKKVPSQTLIRNYWTNELYAVGIRVLMKLESLARISSEQAVHPYVQGAIVLAIYETAKFLIDTKTSLGKFIGKCRDVFVLDERLTNNKDMFKNFFVLSERLIFELVFHDCEDQTECSLLYMLSFPEAVDLLVQSLNANVTLLNQRFTSEKLRKLTTLLLLSGRLDEKMINSFMVHLSQNSKWEPFFRALRSFLGGGGDGAKLLMLLHSVGPHSITIWRLEVDYSSPMYYDNIMKWLSLWAYTYTKSIFVEMQRNWIGGCLTTGWDLDLDYASNAYRIKQRPIVTLITNILSKRSMLHTWILKTKACFHLPVLLRLVTAMYINAISDHLGNAVEVSDFLSRHGVLDVLPLGFSEKIQHTMHMRSCTVNDLVTVFADALAVMGNHLVVLGLPEGCIMCYDLIACIVNIIEMRCANKHQFSSPTATIKCTRCNETKDLICSKFRG